MIEIPGFVIEGAPRSKKTSQKIINLPRAGARQCAACGHRPGFPKLIPSHAHEVWHKSAMEQCLVVKAKLRARGMVLPVVGFVNVRALFYQDVDRADAVGLYESLGDLLQDTGILENDRLIAHWDGSRRLKDATRPRVEVYLEVIQERAVEQELFA